MGGGLAEEYLIPCDPAPELSWLWYADTGKCVRECDEGVSCGGQALGGTELYSTFNECCANHPSWLDCSVCFEDFWDDYFAQEPAPEMGYYPVCKSSVPSIFLKLQFQCKHSLSLI